MKKASSILIFGLAFLSVSFAPPTKQQLIDVNNIMVDCQMKLMDDYDMFFDIVSTGDPVEIKKQSIKWEKDSDDVIAEIEAKEDYEETREMKSALLKLANRQHDYIVKEAKELVSFFEYLVKLPADEDYDEVRFEKIMSDVLIFEEEMGELNDTFIKAQKDFAKKNNIELKD